MSSTTDFISSSLSTYHCVHTLCLSVFMYFYWYLYTLSLDICLEYKLKVLLQSQTISYYSVYIDI